MSNLFSVLVSEGKMSYIRGMQLVRQTILAVCAFTAASTAVAEQRSMDVYSSIVERNPFGLKDPVVPAAPPTNKPAADPKKEDFYLTGISTIGDSKRPKAYLLNKDASKKNYDEKYFTLSAGDKQGELAVKEIDPKGRRVLIAYQGEDRWLSMKDNGVPAPTGPGPGQGGGMPLVPGAPGAIPPAPGAVPTPLPGAAPAHQPLTYPSAGNPNRRTPRSTYSGSANPGFVNPAANQTYATPVYNAPGVANMPGVPTVTPIGNVPGGQPPAHDQGPQTDAELIGQMGALKEPVKIGGATPRQYQPPPPSPF
jgi:hypothetical protein